MLPAPDAPPIGLAPTTGLAVERGVTPDLIGLDLSAACEATAWAGTSLGVQHVQRGRGPFDVVVAQSPAPGTRLRPMWRVHVLISTPAPARREVR